MSETKDIYGILGAAGAYVISCSVGGYRFGYNKLPLSIYNMSDGTYEISLDQTSIKDNVRDYKAATTVNSKMSSPAVAKRALDKCANANKDLFEQLWQRQKDAYAYEAVIDNNITRLKSLGARFSIFTNSREGHLEINTKDGSITFYIRVSEQVCIGNNTYMSIDHFEKMINFMKTL